MEIKAVQKEAPFFLSDDKVQIMSFILDKLNWGNERHRSAHEFTKTGI